MVIQFNEQVDVHLTDDEFRRIEREAKRHGMTVEVFCRMMLIEAARVELLKRQRMEST